MALTQYDLSRSFWDFAFENPEKIKPTHTAIFFFAIEHCNRLGWKVKFGLPTSMVIEAIGIKSYNTYKAHFDDLVEYGFFKIIEYSKNQYSSNIISLSTAISKNDKALDKALIKHLTKQGESIQQSTSESTGSIDKPITINQEQITIDASLPTLKTCEIVWINSKNNFSDNAKDAWIKLCNTKKWKKKEAYALDLSLKKILKYEEGFAIQLIENAAAGGYQGITFANTDDDYLKWQKNNLKSPPSSHVPDRTTVKPLYVPTAKDFD